jgi:hypothetical protein
METVDVVVAHHWADHRECCPNGHPQEGCEEGVHRVPYDELTVDEDFARQLVDAGIANFDTEADAIAAGGDRRRIAPPPDERKVRRARPPTRDELFAQAQAAGIEIGSRATKKEIAAAIAEHEAAQQEQ